MMDMEDASCFAAVENNNADGLVTNILRAFIGFINQLPQSIERVEDKTTACNVANFIILNALQVLKSNLVTHPVAHETSQTSLLPFVAPNVHTEISLISSDYPTVRKLANKLLSTLEYFVGGGRMAPFDLYHVACQTISIARDAGFCCGAVAVDTQLRLPTHNSSDTLPISSQVALDKENIEVGSILMGISTNNSVGTDASHPVNTPSHGKKFSTVAGDAVDGVVGASASEDDDEERFDAWFRKDYAIRLTQEHNNGEKSAIYACFYGLDKLRKEISQKELNACRAKRHRKKKVMEEQIAKLKMRTNCPHQNECEVWVGDTKSGGFLVVEPKSSSALVREMGSPGSSGKFFDGFIMKSWAGLDAIENTRRKVSVPCEVQGKDGQYVRLTGKIEDRVLVESCDSSTDWVHHSMVFDSMKMLVDA